MGVVRVAGVAAGFAALLTPISDCRLRPLAPLPTRRQPEEWFELFHDNALLGLMSLDLAFVVVSILMIPVMLGLYVALRNVRPGQTAIAVVLYLAAAAAYFGTNTAVEMLSLSQR